MEDDLKRKSVFKPHMTLIGKKIKVVHKQSRSTLVEGVVLDETKDTLMVQPELQENDSVKIVKESSIIHVDDVEIDGSRLARRITDRIKHVK